MSYIGVINSEEGINREIKGLFARDNIRNYKILGCEDDILDFINFELPELLIINYSDSGLEIDSIMEKIRKDSWINNFGIIGIFDQDRTSEEDLMKKYPEFNILSLLDTIRFRTSITRCVGIILENKQIVFNRDLSEKLFDKDVGSFEIGNDPFAVSIYAGLVSSMLLQRGLVKPESRMHLQLILSELIINGIEHGNCGITFDEKTAFLDDGGNIMDLIAEKCRNEDIDRKRVRVEWDITRTRSKFIIRDEGSGFDIYKLKAKIEKEGAYALHGRGIRMASLFAERVAYNLKGNAVLLQIRHEKDASREAPEGFSEEEMIYMKKGNIVCREGEIGDSLYYISSGRYSVWHSDKKVGTLNPADIFMGEMSFFLNNERSATVIAETDGIMIKVPRKNFIDIIKKYPQYGLFLAKLLSRKLARANIASAELQSDAASIKASV